MFSRYGRPLSFGLGPLDEVLDVGDGPQERIAARFVVHLADLARQILDQVGGGIFERVSVSFDVGEG